MEKPEPKSIKRLDYHECAKYIEHKLGYDLRDVLGKFSKANRDNGLWQTTEYCDFWHFLMDVCGDVHNGCEIYMPEPKQAKKAWQKVILEEFHKEFGDGPYWVEW